jgi:hypothetical protein
VTVGAAAEVVVAALLVVEELDIEIADAEVPAAPEVNVE